MNTKLLPSLILTVLISQNAYGEIKFSDDINPQFTSIVKNDSIIFEQLEEAGDDSGQELINGTVVNPKKFPAILKMTTGGTCTATIVGPSSIILAAHCVKHNSMIKFVNSGIGVRGYCQQAPGYRLGITSEDWALCLMERNIQGIDFESIELNNPPKPGKPIYLTGFGCIQKGGQLDGRLRFGISTIANRPNGLPLEKSTIYTRSIIANGEPVLCPGDSGGPAFVISGTSVNDARKLVGINSRTTYEFGYSLLSSTASVSGKRFIGDWADQNKQIICGYNETNSISCK